MSQTVEQAVSFIDEVDLPPALTRRGGPLLSDRKESVPATGPQATVVGGEIVSFVAGVDPAVRGAVVNCALLAQLAADRKVASRENIRQWYEAYFEVLGQLGWVFQGLEFSEHHESGDEFQAHRAILSIASVLLGAAPTALAVIETTLSAMEATVRGHWMTVFQRESQSARAARFQVTVAEPHLDGGAVISTMAFELHAEKALTQVLFLKFKASDIKLHYSSGRIVIDKELLLGIAPSLKKKVDSYVHRYIENIPL